MSDDRQFGPPSHVGLNDPVFLAETRAQAAEGDLHEAAQWLLANGYPTADRWEGATTPPLGLRRALVAAGANPMLMYDWTKDLVWLREMEK